MIKKYWKIILSIVTGLVGIFFILSKSNSKKANKAKKKIDDNNTAINKLDGRIEEVKKQKIVAKKKVETTKNKLEKTKQLKKQPIPKKSKVVKTKKETEKSAAANIRKRTRK